MQADEDGNPVKFCNKKELLDILGEAEANGIFRFLSKEDLEESSENPQEWERGVVLLLKIEGVIVPKIKTVAFRIED